MEYSKAIFLMSGEVITITINEAKQIQQQLVGGAEWLSVQGELINAKSVSKVGNHHATALMNKIENQQKKTDLKIKDSQIKKITLNNSNEIDFYVDPNTGEKMYS